MYRGFRIAEDDLPSARYIVDGRRIYQEMKRDALPVLERFILKNGALDAEQMKAAWFPHVDAQIFISHSHADKRLAEGLAGWIYQRTGIRAFIDSCVWSHAQDLLDQLDEKYCTNDRDGKIIYKPHVEASAHVHMMLNTALTKMIDHCECMFFLETTNSTIKNNLQTKTNSAWIYSELAFSQLVRKKIPTRTLLTEQLKLFSGKPNLNESLKEQLRIEYLLELDDLMPLESDDFFSWDYRCHAQHLHSSIHKLDHLYHVKPLKKGRQRL